MPFVQVHTNATATDGLAGRLTDLLAELTGKDAKWVMTRLVADQTMTFGGSSDPTAYVEVKNLGGFAPDKAVDVSAAICTLLEQTIGVPADRVYVEMADPPRHLFGWNGKTFA